MNTTLFHRRRAERFAQLLDEANGARRHHVRTGLDEQLAELVAIGHQVAAMPPPAVEPDPEFRSSLRAMLVATAERDGIGATALPAADTPAAPAVRRPGTRRAPRAGLSAAAPNRLRTRGAILIGIAAGAIAVSGMSAASTNAIPGDALYTVKRSTERAQLALASSDVTRGQLHLDFAQSRVAEAAAVRGESSGFAAVLNDMDADTVHGSRLLHSSAVTRRDPAALDAVEAFVTGQQRSLGTMLDGASAADRARTLKSLSLLDAIGKRAEALRGTLSCGTAPSVGADRLGPKPRSCTVGAAPAGTDADAPAGRAPGQAPAGERPTETTKGTTDERTTPADGPGPRTGADAPVAPALDPSAPAPPPAAGTDEGVMEEVGRILGGILG